MAYWFDDRQKSVGLFLGVGKNIGSTKPLYKDPTTRQPIVYALEPTLDWMFRIQPRVRFIIKPMTIGLELEILKQRLVPWIDMLALSIRVQPPIFVSYLRFYIIFRGSLCQIHLLSRMSRILLPIFL